MNNFVYITSFAEDTKNFLHKLNYKHYWYTMAVIYGAITVSHKTDEQRCPIEV